MSEPDYTADPNLARDPNLRELVEDFCDACEFGDPKAFFEQLDQGQLEKLAPYLKAMARECGLGGIN